MNRSPANSHPIRGYAAAVVLTLAAGVGAGAAVLGVVRAALGSAGSAAPVVPLPVRDDASWLEFWSAERSAASAAQAGDLRTLLLVLGALGALLVAVALVSLFLLMLARGLGLRGGLAVRAALGASAARLSRGRLAEGAGLLACGALAGLGLGHSAARALAATWPTTAVPWLAGALDPVAAAALVGAFAVALLAGSLLPARVGRARDLRGALAAGARATAGPGEVWVREALVVVQLAVSLVLVVGATLLLRGVSGSSADETVRYDPRDTLRLDLALPTGTDARERAALHAETLQRLSVLPGVIDSSVTTPGARLGLGAEDAVTAYCPECSIGMLIKPIIRGRTVVHAVSPGFFAHLGARLLRGRELTGEDVAGSAPVAVVSETFAYRLFPGGDPLGKQIDIGGREGGTFTVVGVVEDVRSLALGTGGEPMPMLYLSALQHPPGLATLGVRTRGDPMAVAPAVAATLHAIDPRVRLGDPGTLEGRLAEHRAPLTWFACVFGLLAAVVVALGAAGLFRAVAEVVRGRTREIGVRMALGSTPARAVRFVVGRGVRLAATGVALGLMGAVPLARLLQLLVTGLDPVDPLVLAGVATLLGTVALAGSYLPARRAASVVPQVALGAE